MVLLENNCIPVKPVIRLPECLDSGRRQDCTHCAAQKNGACRSPMGLCVTPYPGHPRGCPNYGKKDNCPPGMPAFGKLFDVSKPVWCVYSKFDMAGHIDMMRRRHPDWSERQLVCCLYWQAGARKAHRQYAQEVYRGMQPPGFALTDSPEAMGVLVTETLSSCGIALEWPPVHIVYKISFAGFVKPEILNSMRVLGREIVIRDDGYLVIKR